MLPLPTTSPLLIKLTKTNQVGPLRALPLIHENSSQRLDAAVAIAVDVEEVAEVEQHAKNHHPEVDVVVVNAVTEVEEEVPEAGDTTMTSMCSLASAPKIS